MAQSSDAAKWNKLYNDAERGVPMAQALIGAALHDGGKFDAALVWLRKAAEQQREPVPAAMAESVIGNMYADGRGVRQDYAEALKWYRRSGEKGNADAQLSLGICYYSGNGVTQDFAEATRWFRKSAEQGTPDAQARLAACYMAGDGVEQDYIEAHKWANIAAARANGDAQKRYAGLRDELAKTMSREQIAEAQKRAREWIEASNAGKR